MCASPARNTAFDAVTLAFAQFRPLRSPILAPETGLN